MLIINNDERRYILFKKKCFILSITGALLVSLTVIWQEKVQAADAYQDASITTPVSKNIEEQFAPQETFIFNDDEERTQLTDAEKNELWRQGLPVPLDSIPDETVLPRKSSEWYGEGDTEIAQDLLTVRKTRQDVVIVDGWSEIERETFEVADAESGGCQWRTGYN